MTVPARFDTFLDPSATSLARQIHGILTARPLSSPWGWRAVSLADVLGRALQELERQGLARFDVATLRGYCVLGRGVDPDLAPVTNFILVDEVSASAWTEMRTRQGVTELYLRGLNGELSEDVLERLHGFMGTLDGFDVQLALPGREQDVQCVERHGRAAAQVAQPLALLEDGLGFGEMAIPELKDRLHAWVLGLPR